MSSPVILPTNFDIKNVSFSDPRKNPVGGQSIFLNYKNDNDFKTGPVILQTPKMRIPFGVGVSDLDNSGTLKYALNASLADKGSGNEKLKEFTELIRSIDEHTLKYATNNSEKWFGKVQKAEILEEFYKSAEKKSKNDKYASTIKLKLPIRGKDDKQHPDFKIYERLIYLKILKLIFHVLKRVVKLSQSFNVPVYGLLVKHSLELDGKSYKLKHLRTRKLLDILS